MNQLRKQQKKNSTKHHTVFKIILLFIPLLIFFIFEITFRLINYGDNLHLFVKSNTPGYDKFMMVNPNVGKKYFQKFEYTSPPNDIFYATKPAKTFRIFVLGSSTVYGFPYDGNLMFSRILNKQLEDYFPDKKIEVVNTAITAINSFTLLDYADQILKFEPDAILIYAGHNEFYGAFGVGSNETMGRNRALTRLHLKLMRMRLYQLVRNSISGFTKHYTETSVRTGGTLMKRIVNDADIEYDSDVYNLGMSNYQKNMNTIISKFQKKNIPVFISDLVSNVKDLEPFSSVKSSSLPSALEVFAKAMREEEKGNFEEAKALYYKAKDLDCIRFRASEDANEIISKMSEKPGIFKVSVLNAFIGNSENGLIGDNLMTEHVHPNIDGVFLISKAFLDKIIESGVIGEPNKNINYSTKYYKTNWGYSELDSLIGMHRANFLKGFWPFVKDGQEKHNYFQNYQPENYLDLIVISELRSSGQSLGITRLGVARNYEKEGRYDLAYREYEAILRENPYVAIHYRDAAKALIKLDDLPLAMKYYTKSIEYEKSFEAFYAMGDIFMKKGDFENAIESFEESIKYASKEEKENVLHQIFAAYSYCNMPLKADSVAREIELNGNTLLYVDKWLYVYDKIVPFQTRSQLEMAKQLIVNKEYGDALNMLEKSLEIYDSHIANRLIAELNLKLKNYGEAQRYFLKVYNEFKFDPAFLHQLVLLQLEMGEKEIAKEYWHEIKKIDPDYWEIEYLK